MLQTQCCKQGTSCNAAGSMASYCIKTEARQVMARRADMLHATVDFNRPYRDIVNKRGWWVMEEWLHFTETWSNVILQPYKDSKGKTVHILHDDELRAAWKALRHVVSHLMRADDEHVSAQACTAVAEALATYSKHVESVFGLRACTYNLHMIVCRYAMLCKHHKPYCNQWSLGLAQKCLVAVFVIV